MQQMLGANKKYHLQHYQIFSVKYCIPLIFFVFDVCSEDNINLMKSISINKDDTYLTGDHVEVSKKEALQDEAAAAGPANPSSLELGEKCEQWWWVEFFPVTSMFLQYISC